MIAKWPLRSLRLGSCFVVADILEAGRFLAVCIPHLNYSFLSHYSHYFPLFHCPKSNYFYFLHGYRNM